MIIFIIIAVLFLFGLCLCLPKARHYYVGAIKRIIRDTRRSFKSGHSIIQDYFINPFKTPKNWKRIALMPLTLPITTLLICFAILFMICIYPAVCIVWGFVKEGPVPQVSPVKQEIKDIEVEKDFVFTRETLRYSVPVTEMSFEPSYNEVIFFNPTGDDKYDELFRTNLEDIKKACIKRNMHFIYLPEYNKETTIDNIREILEYANPGFDINNLDSLPPIDYSDIAAAYHVPETVQEPCLVRCMSTNINLDFRQINGMFDPTGIGFDTTSLHFSIHFLESTDRESLISELSTYCRHLYSGPMFSLRRPEADEEQNLEEYLDADEFFDDEIYRIGQEIADRIEQLKAKGLSSLAIRKLIGSGNDKPGKLLIDRYNRLILTDFGNKEIKLSPIHKAVFFLFLRHPEGIYFKDLADYKEELGSIYKEITGRDDLEGIEDSINKLTDPYDNSINEKCARIKNAFVSEFREEIAQWYFINGSKGEKKSIKLPRELVTWEIKD